MDPYTHSLTAEKFAAFKVKNLTGYWDQTHNIKVAAGWRDAGFSPEEMAVWRPITEGDPNWAKRWRDAGFSSDETQNWLSQQIWEPTDSVKQWQRAGRSRKPSTKQQKTR